MIILNVCERQATALVKGRVTTDSVGLPVEVNLSQEYDGLAVWVCFRAGETAADVALIEGTEVTVPSQCLQVAGEALQVGVWAGDGDGNVRIPTVWASAGTIKQGTERSGIDPAGPAPDWAAQVQQYAQDAHDTAERLAEIAGVDIHEFAADMFEAGERLDNKTAEEVFLQDFKLFMCGDTRFGVAQGTYMTKDNMETAKQLLSGYLTEARYKQNVEDLYILLSNIPESASTVLHLPSVLSYSCSLSTLPREGS